MPTISATNSGSGLDVRNLVDQLVAAEGSPVSSRLDRKEVAIQEGLTGIGSFKGALIDFQTSLTPLRKADAFKAINATSSNEEKFTVSAADNAVTGSYELEIEQLAQSQKLKSPSFESEFDEIGTGTIHFEFGEINNNNNSFQVNGEIPPQSIKIEEGSNSLRDIQAAINNENIGVRASVINDGSGFRLILNAEKSGVENSLRISVSDDDVNDEDLFGLSLLAYNPVAVAGPEGDIAAGKNLEEVASAKNALFSIDGISVSSNENSVKDNIPGITLMLKKLTEGTPESFKVEQDTSGVKRSIETFVASYNEMMTTASSLTGFNAETRQAGPLSGDAAIRGIINQIRRLLSTSFNGINEDLTSLSRIGISSNQDGTLALDKVKLDTALKNNADEIAHLFAATISTSDPQVRIVSEKIPAVDGVFKVSINGFPDSGSLTGKQLSDYPDDIYDVHEKIAFIVDGITTSELGFSPRRYESGDEFATELQNKINNDQFLKEKEISVSVSYADNRLKITSNNIGSSSSVDVKSISQNLSFITGLSVSQGEAGHDLTADVAGETLVADGSKFKLAGKLSGVVLDISGNKVGERGVLTVTNGVASILDELTKSFLANDGLLDARVDGYNSRIKNIEKQRGDLVRKLEVTEQRYLKQFSNLDAMLGKMRSTSNFLSEKLSALPGSGRK